MNVHKGNIASRIHSCVDAAKIWGLGRESRTCVREDRDPMVGGSLDRALSTRFKFIRFCRQFLMLDRR